MRSAFDIGFFTKLKDVLREKHEEFADRIDTAYASGELAAIGYEVGYRRALIDIEDIGHQIEDALTGAENN